MASDAIVVAALGVTVTTNEAGVASVAGTGVIFIENAAGAPVTATDGGVVSIDTFVRVDPAQ